MMQCKKVEISENDIAEIPPKIIQPKALGRSSLYPRLLNYLLEQSYKGNKSSEEKLARDVFKKKSVQSNNGFFR